MATKISNNFTLEEFIDSPTAKAKGINNTPNSEEKNNIINLVNNVLQPIRIKYGHPIKVSSGFRGKQLNALVGGSKTSQHCNGSAADIKASGTTNKVLFDLIRKMINSGEIKVGQLIWEFGNNSEPQWIHVSLPYSKVNQVLQAVKINGKTTYKQI